LPLNKQGISPVCSPAGDAGKNEETCFMRCSTVCPNRKQWVAKGKISIYIVKVNFPKIVAFKGTFIKYLNIVAGHIEGIPPYAYPSG
jgi:hypothetical protein